MTAGSASARSTWPSPGGAGLRRRAPQARRSSRTRPPRRRTGMRSRGTGRGRALGRADHPRGRVAPEVPRRERGRRWAGSEPRPSDTAHACTVDVGSAMSRLFKTSSVFRSRCERGPAPRPRAGTIEPAEAPALDQCPRQCPSGSPFWSRWRRAHRGRRISLRHPRNERARSTRAARSRQRLRSVCTFLEPQGPRRPSRPSPALRCPPRAT
jgi:hypothetical protein